MHGGGGLLKTTRPDQLDQLGAGDSRTLIIAASELGDGFKCPRSCPGWTVAQYTVDEAGRDVSASISPANQRASGEDVASQVDGVSVAGPVELPRSGDFQMAAG
jgi:hypothetical protein